MSSYAQICTMTYKDLGALTAPLEAVKSLFAEMTAMKEELSAIKSDVARLNRNNTKLVVENRNLKAELAPTKEELARLRKEAPVEKDSTNSSIPPTKQSIAKQIIQHTSSLRKPSGKKPGGQPGHVGHSLDKNTDLSLDFAAWQTIARYVAFYHSLRNERSFYFNFPICMVHISFCFSIWKR